jgi:hypothetical protein
MDYYYIFFVGEWMGVFLRIKKRKKKQVKAIREKETKRISHMAFGIWEKNLKNK